MKCTIIGLGQFGVSLTLELARAGHEVSVIDVNEAHLNAVKEHVTLTIKADATRPEVLEQLGVADMDLVVVAIGEGFEPSLLITSHLKRLGVKRLHVRVVNPVHEQLLDLLGVEGKVKAESMAAEFLARTLTHDAILRHFALDQSHAIAELPTPIDWIGRTLIDSGLRKKYGLNLITVRRSAENAIAGTAAPVLGVLDPDFTFQRGDNLIVFGTELALDNFANKLKFS